LALNILKDRELPKLLIIKNVYFVWHIWQLLLAIFSFLWTSKTISIKHSSINSLNTSIDYYIEQWNLKYIYILLKKKNIYIYIYIY